MDMKDWKEQLRAEFQMEEMPTLESFITSLLASERADWLRSEIEKLEGMKKTKTFPQQLIHFDHSVEYIERLSDGDIHYNYALTSIITRYKEELVELEKVSHTKTDKQ